MSPQEFSQRFRHDVGGCLLQLLEHARKHGLEDAPVVAIVSFQSLALSATFHTGTRDEFMQLARDAYAVARTGELEQ